MDKILSSSFKSPKFFLPHRPPMLFIDEVLYIDDARAITLSVNSPRGSLQVLTNDSGALPNFALIELVAQCTGVWASEHCIQKHGQPLHFGMLINIRSFIPFIEEVSSNSLIIVDSHIDMTDGKIAVANAQVYSIVNKHKYISSKEQYEFFNFANLNYKNLSFIKLKDSLKDSVFIREQQQEHLSLVSIAEASITAYSADNEIEKIFSNV